MIGARLRVFTAGVLAAGLVSAPVAFSSAARAGRGRWHTHRLVPAGKYVGGVQLAVSETGAAFLAWVQGTPPRICVHAPCGHRGFRVMFAQGTAGGGFGRSRELSADGLGGIYAAQLSAGISYVAWNEVARTRWRIVAIQHGHVSKPTVLPAGAKLQGLFTGHSRQVAAVWVSPGKPRWTVHYAFLDRHARLARQGNIAQIGAPSFTYPQIALNDQGDLAAIWAQGSRQHHGRGGAFPDVKLAWCDARGHCVASRRLAVPNPTPYLTVAVTDRGTVVALVGAHPRVWSAVAHVGRPGVRVSKLAVGASPMAVSQGVAGVAAMFSPRRGRLAWTFYDPAKGRFTRPRAVRDSSANGSPQLAASLAGQVLASWFHATRRSSELRAVVGNGTKRSRRRVVASAGQRPAQTYSVWSAERNIGASGISGRGNAIVTWELGTQNGPHGLYYAIRLRG